MNANRGQDTSTRRLPAEEHCYHSGDSNKSRGRPSKFRLSVVVPAFNEAENIPLLLERICEATAAIPSLEIIVVDDGSSDESAEVLRASNCKSLRYLLLSRNFGHQAALRAGLEEASGDCIVCMDADMQHPPTLLREMVREWQMGADIVSCLRQDAAETSWLKRLTSRWFYRGLNWVSGLHVAQGSSDFRLIDREVLLILNQMPESDLFYRGIVPTLGFRVTTIDYVPDRRRLGESKYTVRKMTRLALTGMISSSSRPLRLATYFAFLTALGALVFLAYVLYIYFVRHTGVPGWASTLAVVLIIGTMQLLVLGVIGEYLGQVLREARRRPSYIVAESGGLSVQRIADVEAAQP